MVVKTPVICSVCDSPQVIDFLRSFEHTGLHGADLRPSGSAAWIWTGSILRCTECAACGESLESFPGTARPVVRSADYRAIANAAIPPPIRDAMAASLLAERIGWDDRAFRYALAATWSADDEDSRRDKTGEPRDPGLGDAARSLAIRLWLEQCGDVLHTTIPRGHETAEVSPTGEPLLDNQVLVDLLRRVGNWADATTALKVARVALADTVEQWAEVGWPETQDQRDLLDGCESLLDLEAGLIEAKDARPADARVALPAWWADD